MLAPHPVDPMRRVLAVGKSNHAGMVPTLEFRIEICHFELNGKTFRDVRAVDWTDSDIDLDEAMRASMGVHDRESSKAEEAADAICEALQAGPRGSAEVKAEVMAKIGCALKTVDRAASELRDDRVLGSFGAGKATTWHLLSEAPSEPRHQSCHPLRDGDDTVGDTVAKTPENTGQTASSTQPCHHVISNDDMVGDGSSENGQTDDRARAIEILRQVRERR
jgi:hypothetical protein